MYHQTQENLPPIVVKTVGRELADLGAVPLEGITVQYSEKDLTEISAVIQGPDETPYKDGEFRVRLSIPREYPQVPPKGLFLTKIFHPNVNADSGEICVNTLKRDWTPDLGLKHILLTIKCLLLVPNAESALNTEAGKLLLEDYHAYFSRARMMTEVHAFPEHKMKLLMFPPPSAAAAAKTHQGKKTQTMGSLSPHGAGDPLANSSSSNIPPPAEGGSVDENTGPSDAKRAHKAQTSSSTTKPPKPPIKDKKKAALKRL